MAYGNSVSSFISESSHERHDGMAGKATYGVGGTLELLKVGKPKGPVRLDRLRHLEEPFRSLRKRRDAQRIRLARQDLGIVRKRPRIRKHVLGEDVDVRRRQGRHEHERLGEIPQGGRAHDRDVVLEHDDEVRDEAIEAGLVGEVAVQGQEDLEGSEDRRRSDTIAQVGADQREDNESRSISASSSFQL